MDSEPDSKNKFKRGRPDHHDPTAGIAGAPPALSALTLRIVLSSLGLLCGLGVIVVALTAVRETPLLLGGIGLAILAAINLLVVIRRKARGEPG